VRSRHVELFEQRERQLLSLFEHVIVNRPLQEPSVPAVAIYRVEVLTHRSDGTSAIGDSRGLSESSYL